MTGNTFVPVAGGDLNLQDIVPTGDSIDEGVVNIQTLDAAGRTTGMYTYWGDDMFDDDCPAGWYTDEERAEITFATGTGLWVAGPNSEHGLTFAGQVPTEDVKVVLRAGFTATANMMPIALSIQDIVPEGDNVDEGVVNIQTLDSAGRTTGMYTYWGDDMFDDDCPAGWYTDEERADVTFPAGTGLWVAGPNAETSIVIPAPEL